MTTYTLLAIYQVHENYAAHNGFDGTFRWKAKGGLEVIVQDNITPTEHFGTKHATWEALVALAGPESDDYYSYTIIDWQMITLDDTTVERVRKHLEKCEGEDLGFVRYQYSTEYAFDWALAKLKEQGAIEITGDATYSTYKLKECIA